MANPINSIEAVDLTRRFGEFIAVDGITFSVTRGEVFGFLGANGAGKTTAIRMFCGLLEPTSGSGLGRRVRHHARDRAHPLAASGTCRRNSASTPT